MSDEAAATVPEAARLLRLLFRTARDVRKNALSAAALWIAIGLVWVAREGARASGIPEPYAGAAAAIGVGWTVWSFVSAALTRLAALEIGGGKEPRLAEALRFAAARFFVQLFTVPSMIVAAVVFLLPAALAGLALRIPAIGPVVSAVLFPAALLSAFAAAAAVAAFSLGSPLVSAGLSVDGLTGFDAVSRAFSYLVNAPGWFAWLRLATLAYGAAAFALRGFLALLAASGATAALALAAGVPLPAPLWPMLDAGRVVLPSPGESTVFSVALAAFYSYFAAFALSYACTARVVLYLALRRKVDGTHACVVGLIAAAKRAEALAETP
jgi:hypothetical protein